MTTDIVVYNEHGEITCAASLSNETLEFYANNELRLLLGTASADTHYVLDEALVLYSEKELTAKANLLPGWIWKMPERIAIDPRDDTQRASDEAQAVIAARQAGYPPLADLADALYWQTQGDESKMTTYLARCAAVKAAYPKA